jgi:hypothetical protein
VLEAGDFAYTYEVGQNAQYMPDEVGVALKAGSKVYFEGGHFHSIGKEVKVQIQVGFKFRPKGFTPKYPNRWRRSPPRGLGAELDIPGNTDNIVANDAFVLTKPMKMVSFEPHLHAGGKRMCAEAILPDGRRQTINCAGYRHTWVRSYVYEDDYAPLLPAGTIFHVTAWYNNTAGNPLVVDPRNWRGLGNRSIDEMFVYLGKWIELTDDEYKAEIASRAAKLNAQPSRSTSANQQ